MGDWMDEPIVDPTVPRRERLRLISRSSPLADRDLPRYVRWQFGVAAVVTCVGGTLFTIAAARTDGESAGLSALMVLVIMLVLVGLSRPGMGHRRPRRYTGRYVVPSELDDAALDLLGRARQAVREVTASRVHQLGLLDAIADDIVLPDRLWEIARLLRTHTELRAEQAEAMLEVMTPELAAVLGSQRQALGRSVAAVAEWVRELEEYALRVRAADAALRAHELRQSDDRYRDLLARTADTEGLTHLIDQADALNRTLRRTLG
ncbi:hypothetical protein [Nonomuraea sp. NPDC049480]|uniref:hypothetical protein n=1 Tax=Nonomuraea sp. NPDC049480 TaxID=3364353 RepID=UPI0037ACB2D9